MSLNTWTYPRTVLVPPLSRRANLALIWGASLFIALLAQVRLPLPFTPVPITGQTLAVLLVGAALGPRRGAAAVLLYLAEGVLGLPVFSGGGSGWTYLWGPTGGYLVGFVAAAWVAGSLAVRGWDRQGRRAWLVFLLAEGALYLPGLAWLSVYVGPQRVLALGLYPFVLGDVLKALLAGALLPTVWRWVR